MGKFFEALKKSQKDDAPGVPQPIPRTNDREASVKKVESLKLDPGTARRVREMPPIRQDGMDTRLQHFLEPDSVAAECFKMLRTKLLTTNAKSRPRSIMVTSPQPLDGKSTVSVNLAIHLAMGLNEHVVLVDCDLRRPTLHRLLGVNSDLGLCQYLEEGTSVAPFLLKTNIDKLTFLPAGKTPRNPSELLSSDKMKQLVEELKSRYPDRYIVFDATPAEGAAETTSLSHMMDTVLLVVRSGKTARDRILKAVENIGRERILGVVFNASPETLRDYNYYYGHYRKASRR